MPGTSTGTPPKISPLRKFLKIAAVVTIVPLTFLVIKNGFRNKEIQENKTISRLESNGYLKAELFNSTMNQSRKCRDNLAKDGVSRIDVSTRFFTAVNAQNEKIEGLVCRDKSSDKTKVLIYQDFKIKNL